MCRSMVQLGGKNVTCPDRADGESLILVEVGLLSDMHCFFYTSSMPVGLPVNHRAAFPVYSVVFV